MADKKTTTSSTELIWNMNCATTNLKKGSKGEQVKQLQTFLKSKGWYTRQIDGSYGNYTVKAVKKFQAAYKLKQDGIFGSISCKKVTEILKKDTTVKTKQNTTTTVNKNNTSRILGVDEYENDENLNAKITLLAKRVAPPQSEVIDTGSEATTTTTTTDDSSTDDTSTDTDTSTDDSSDDSSTDDTSTDTESSTETTTTKVTDISKIEYVDPFTDEKKWKDYTITDIYELNVSDDLSDLSHEATFKVVYSDDLFKQLAKYRACKLEINRQGSTQYILEGFLTDVSRSQENNLPIINITINGFQSYLEQQVEFNASDKKSVLLKALCDMCGLKLDLDLEGLTDDTYELKTGSSSSSENSEGSSNTAGDDATKRAEIFAKAATWSYGGASYQDPEQAYKWTEAHKCGDCFCASASLFYQFKTFTSYGVRIVVGYSPYARSGTHRTIQLKENGQWIDPPEYSKMTRNLRVLHNSRHTFQNYIRE